MAYVTPQYTQLRNRQPALLVTGGSDGVGHIFVPWGDGYKDFLPTVRPRFKAYIEFSGFHCCCFLFLRMVSNIHVSHHEN